VKSFFACLIVALACSCVARAQDGVALTEQTIAGIFEEYTAENGETIDYDTFFDELMDCSRNPINLNHTTQEELEKLFFLSDIQVENILAYVYLYGSLQTIYELQLIEGLDMTDIRRMIPFVTIGKGDVTHNRMYTYDILKHGKNELYFRLDKGLETKEGYQFSPEETQNDPQTNSSGYVGNQLYSSIKYRFHYKDRIQAGITAEKDAGEQFWGPVHKGYDFYSCYAQFNHFGKFKTIVVGDYRANFGQGLVLHPEFSLGKSSFVLNVTPRSTGLQKSSSTNESAYFRGGGATFQVGNFDLSAFYSNKMIDADTVHGTFKSILKAGYHRTLDELSKKHTVNQQILGGNATFTRMNLQAGVTLVHTLFDKRLEPDRSTYNYFYLSGNQQTTGGLFYRLRWNKFNLFGETAMTGNGALATLNGCFFNPVPQVSLVILHRYYSPEYDTFYATSFSETSRLNNETGLYIGAEVRPFSKWKFAAYADSYRFPWPKYGIDAPSWGKDYMLQADFTTNKDMAMYWRFRFEEKQSNLSNSGAIMPVVVPVRKTSMRYNLTYVVGNFSFKNILESNMFRRATAGWTYGAIASQDISIDFRKIPLKLNVRCQFFDAVNYDNRFYPYERDVLYAFSIPMYYGKGSRYYLNLRYDLNNHVSCWFKIARTVYANDRESIGNGNETISGNSKTDMRFLFKWEF
jgi:hypothetical protein